MQEGMGLLLITDPSPAFCRIVEVKSQDVQVKARSVDLAVLSAEDIAVLSPGSVSLILLRSVLHHITDVDGFSANLLKTPWQTQDTPAPMRTANEFAT